MILNRKISEQFYKVHNNLECTEERQFETRFENLLKMTILNFEFDFQMKEYTALI